MGTTVTIDRDYFETLLRRAELVQHSTSHELSTPLDLPIVSIPKCDHVALLQAAQEYSALRDALVEGGVSRESLNILICNGLARQKEPTQEKKLNPQAIPFKHGQAAESFDITPDDSVSTLNKSMPLASWVNGVAPKAPLAFQASSKRFGLDQPPDFETPGEWQVCTADRTPNTTAGKRTLLFQNVASQVTHGDIVRIVRGGALMDIHLRPQEKIAQVSFVEPAAAQAFLKHARREVMYLHGKMLDVSLAEHSFTPSANVARQITFGATRNLALHGLGPDVDEDRIRDDLEHIHGLVTLDVTINGGTAIVRLNAIHLALFARSCLRSRTAYRKCAIQFHPDECAEPLPASGTHTRSIEKKAAKNKPLVSDRLQPLGNRFQMLSMDSTEDESENPNSETISSYQSESALDLEGVAIAAQTVP